MKKVLEYTCYKVFLHIFAITILIKFFKKGEVPEWLNGADCKSVGAAFGGSNPSLPTFY
jgi:hypothetical protein